MNSEIRNIKSAKPVMVTYHYSLDACITSFTRGTFANSIRKSSTYQ